MFLGFLTEEVGILVPTDEQVAAVNEKRRASGRRPVDKYCFIKQLDYTTEWWWNNDKMLEQTEAVIDVLQCMLPSVQFAFFSFFFWFDRSSVHHCYPADAVIAKHMN